MNLPKELDGYEILSVTITADLGEEEIRFEGKSQVFVTFPVEVITEFKANKQNLDLNKLNADITTPTQHINFETKDGLMVDTGDKNRLNSVVWIPLKDRCEIIFRYHTFNDLSILPIGAQSSLNRVERLVDCSKKYDLKNGKTWELAE